MKKSKFSDCQIMEALKRVESGLGMFSGMPKQKSARKALVCWLSGGEGGIRTRGEFYPTHAFQACDLNRSSTSPRQRAIVAAGLVLGPGDGRWCLAGVVGLLGPLGAVGVALQVF